MQQQQDIPTSSETVVIGGGIVGCSIALEMARRGVGVTLLDKGRLAGEQSARAWGFVRQQDRHPAELPLMIAGNRIWRELEGQLGARFDWVNGGILALAATQDELAHYEARARLEQEHGVDSRMVTAEEVRGLLPGFTGPVLGALHTPSDGQAHPEKATLAIADAARAAGANILHHCIAERILTGGGRVTGVQTPGGVIATGQVICAGGAHSSRLLRGLGLDLPVRTVRSTVAVTEPIAPLTRLAVRGIGVSFRQGPNGEVWLGRTSSGSADYDLTLESFRHLRWFLPNYFANRDLVQLRLNSAFFKDVWNTMPWSRARRHPFAHTVDHEPRVNTRTAEKNRRAFMAQFPGLGEVRLNRAWAGIIDTLPDILPVIGPAPNPAGLYITTGFSGHGFAMGPIVGRLVAEHLTGTQPSQDLHPFRFTRFAEGDLADARPLR